MTNREFFNAIIEAEINEELTAHAKAQIEKLDTRNATRSSKPSKAQLENEGIKQDILKTLKENGPMFANQIAKALDTSTNKVSALCTQLIGAGKVEANEVKVPKKGKCRQYSLADVAEVTE